MSTSPELPEVRVTPDEQVAVMAGAVVTAGLILGDRVADAYVQLATNNGGLDFNTESHVLVQSALGQQTTSVALRVRPWSGRLTLGTTNTDRVGGQQHNTRTWLDRTQSGGLQRVTATSVADGEPHILGSEPTALESAASYMIIDVCDYSTEIPDDRRPAFEPQAGPEEAAERVAVESRRLVPVVADLLQIVGGALRVPPQEGRMVDAKLQVEVSSSGRVYGYGGVHAGEQTVALSTVDRRTRRGVDFSMTYRFGGIDGEVEHSLVEAYLRTEQRTDDSRVVTRDVLGRRGSELVVIQKRQVDTGPVETTGMYQPDSYIITTMAEKAVAAATAPSA